MMRTLTTSILVGVIISVIGIVSFFAYQRGRAAKAAEDTVTVNISELGAGSDVAQSAGTVSFSLFSDPNTYIYENPSSNTNPTETAYEIIDKSITVQDENVKGASTLGAATVTTLLPPQITEQLTQTKVIEDTERNRTHVSFEQKINGVPVFGSHVAIHTEGDDKVYAMTGAIINESSIKQPLISEREALDKALRIASPGASLKLNVTKEEKMLFNPSLIGLNSDTTTYPVLAVSLVNEGTLLSYSHTLYISLVDGSLMYDEDEISHALNRNVYDCARNAENCQRVRIEGSQPSGVADADSTYTHLGLIYSFFMNVLGRDSFDGVGSTLRALVNLPDFIGEKEFCPNAAWIKSTKEMYICPQWAVLDIVAHEFAHGVTSATVGFINMNQSGALDEAFADMIGVTIDNDWLIGEDQPIGVLRDLSNPAVNQPPSPDRLFSSRYYCGEQDSGGIHINMAIPTKAFYLMTTGGQFNGCTMTGIGKEKSVKIWYQALTRYLSFNSNFRDAYNAVVQACTDLYGAGSTECITTRAALQATEMDQQPLAADTVQRCGGAAPKPATCSVPVTSTPTPTTPTVTGQCALGDADCNGSANLVDYEMWRREYLELSTSKEADFNKDNSVNLVDFEIWRRAFLKL